MASLAPALRKKLEDAVKEARDVAEAGARAALEQLAVHAAEPFAHLGPEDRELRNRLRARARQLGDGRDTRTGAHQIDHLVVECAYEHWHRMLFARFLAENGVLMANSEALGIENTPVTLEECEELAADEGAANGWELAGRYASKMLPQIFRPDAPVLAVHLPPERQRRLEQILAELAPATFKASDALGWVYQFWQAKKKDEVNASGVKIGADELPAVTQLFTEPYMVDFLLHNTLGAWWAGKVLAERPELARTAKSEDELREACSLPGCSWTYLRFVHDGGAWRPAAESFDNWPSSSADLRVLDPCCGSGHFLVEVFRLLTSIRMAEHGLSAAEATDAVLRDNIFGLELDERCTQLAAFSLALAAWTYPGGEYFRKLPALSIACTGVAPRSERDEWLALAGTDAALRAGMSRLYTLFQSAPTLGSLLDPTSVGFTGRQQEIGVAGIEELGPLLQVQLSGANGRRDPHSHELGVAAQGIAFAADVLSQKYHLVATNFPYLSRGRQTADLRKYCDEAHPEAKNELASVFLERSLRLLDSEGAVASVGPQNWMQLSRYRRFRQALLNDRHISLWASLGTGAFGSISGEVVNIALTVVRRKVGSDNPQVAIVDVASTSGDKAAPLRESGPLLIAQRKLRENPDARIVVPAASSLPLLARIADSRYGLRTADSNRFIRKYWELPAIASPWRYHQSTPSSTMHFGGREHVLRDDGALHRFAELGLASLQGGDAWGRTGVAVSLMGDLPSTIYTGEHFDNNTAALWPRDPCDLAAVWSFIESGEFTEEVRRLDSTVKVTNATLLKVPFDLSKWRAEAAERYPEGLPAPASDDPTQWVHRGVASHSAEPLQVGVAALLGYRWPEQQAENGLADHIDDDGIACLPSVRGEEPASDRLVALLAAAYGASWQTAKRDALLTAVGAKGKGLGWWLQNKFFEQHCQLFQHRPFIWHIWDGIKKDGFGALVNYHKLDRKLLETLTYTYLGDWIRRQQDDAARNVDGASERLDAARRLQQSLELILEGEKPHDIFVRWKPLREQPIGWEPDLNDGVRVNIRPFMSVPDVDKKGAGVLRYKPNIHWKKDRGSDPDDAPWFELGPTYGEPKGARINDHHLSLAEKRAARERAGGR